MSCRTKSGGSGHHPHTGWRSARSLGARRSPAGILPPWLEANGDDDDDGDGDGDDDGNDDDYRDDRDNDDGNDPLGMVLVYTSLGDEMYKWCCPDAIHEPFHDKLEETYSFPPG